MQFNIFMHFTLHMSNDLDLKAFLLEQKVCVANDINRHWSQLRLEGLIERIWLVKKAQGDAVG